MSVDGTDVPKTEPSPFSRTRFSYKLKEVGLRYEVGVSINGGHIVWINGPFRTG